MGESGGKAEQEKTRSQAGEPADLVPVPGVHKGGEQVALQTRATKPTQATSAKAVLCWKFFTGSRCPMGQVATSCIESWGLLRIHQRV